MNYTEEKIGKFVLKVDTWNPNKEFDYIDLSSIDKNSKKIDERLVTYIYAQEAPSRARQLVKLGDVLIATVRPNLNGIALVEKDYKNGTASTGYCVLRSSEKLSSKYLFYWVQTKTFIQDMLNKATGANYPAVSDRIIKESKIPLPPLPTQQKIASILDAADELRQKDKALIAKYNELTQSLFLDMFGEVIKNPKNWNKVALGELSTIRRGASPRPISDFVGSDIPWIKIGDGTKNSDGIYLTDTEVRITQAGAEKSVLLKTGSLIFANCGVSLGFARILKIDGCIHDGWLSMENINESLINKVFLLKVLNSTTDYFRKTAPDGTQPNLNTSIMKNFMIPIPPLELQNNFEKSLFFIEKQKQLAEQSQKKSEALFNSLLDKAFKGELVTES